MAWKGCYDGAGRGNLGGGICASWDLPLEEGTVLFESVLEVPLCCFEKHLDTVEVGCKITSNISGPLS